MLTLQIYFLCSLIVMLVMNYNLQMNLEYDTQMDEDVKKLFNNKYIRCTVLIIASIFWIITIPYSLWTLRKGGEL